MGNPKHRLLTFVDLLTLLLVVAVVLYFMSDGDRQKYRQVVADLTRVFRGGEVPVSTGEAVIPGDEPPAAQQPEPPDPAPAAAAPPTAAETLSDRFRGDARYTAAENSRGLVITMTVSVAFGSGSAELPPALLPLLEAVAKRLEGLPNQIVLEGFSDNVPISTAEFRSNQELSVARAVRVQAFLEARGIARERIAVVGYGETRPVAPNDTPEGRARNRRVDLVILNLSEQALSSPGK